MVFRRKIFSQKKFQQGCLTGAKHLDFLAADVLKTLRNTGENRFSATLALNELIIRSSIS